MPFKFCNGVWSLKAGMRAYQVVKNFHCMYNRFDTIPALNG